MDGANLAALVAELVSLVKWIYQWGSQGHDGSPSSFSLLALDALLRTHPDARAGLLEKARQDPATAQQIKHLAEALGDRMPSITSLAAEI